MESAQNLNKMHFNRIVSILYFIFFSIVGFSQIPEWVTITPVVSEYYIGISNSNKNYSNYQNLATKQALSIISEQIQINIKSSNEMFVSENSAGVNQDFFKNVRTSSNVQLQGYELYANWEDEENYYVYYRLSKQKFKENLSIEYDKAINNSNKKISDAQSYLNNYKINEAVAAYLSASKFLEKLLGNSFIQEKHAEIINNWNLIKSDILKISNYIQISPLQTSYVLSKNKVFDTDILVKSFYLTNGDKYDIEQVPVIFELSNNINAFYRKSRNSDFNGFCKNKITNIYNESLNYTITCSVDFSNYLNRFGEYLILEDDMFDKLYSSCNMSIEVIPLTVSIKSNERIFSSPRDFLVIKNEAINYLRRNNILISNDTDNSNYLIEIRADTRKGTYYNGVYSSFLNIEYSVNNNETGVEIYSGFISDIKGVSLNYYSAAEKAYDNVRDELNEKLVRKVLPYLK